MIEDCRAVNVKQLLIFQYGWELCVYSLRSVAPSPSSGSVLAGPCACGAVEDKALALGGCLALAFGALRAKA